MEKSNHSMLVGNGARSFAHNMGFVSEANNTLLTGETQSAYEQFKLTNCVDQTAHDTLCKKDHVTHIIY